MGRVRDHNQEVRSKAEYRAMEMRRFPSKLEERMEDFLKKNNVQYEAQKVFYIYSADKWIARYYIADFFIPKRHIIIEVDGKFHDKHKLHDKLRTLHITEQYPNVTVCRYRWGDLSDEKKMGELLKRIS